MAFSGDPVAKQVSDRLVRITGASLEPSEVGTIGLADATGTPPDVVTPDDFQPHPYWDPPVSLSDSVQVDILPTSQALMVEKSGSTPADFRIAITNVGAGGGGQQLTLGATTEVTGSQLEE